MEKPLISIIVPVYNTEKYIKRCVDNLLLQTYDNIQIVLVDDGSTDMSAKICDELSSENDNIKTVHKQNEGTYKARITGVSIADGEYIGFMDSDDEIDPTMFEILYENLRSDGADISHCGYKIIRKNSEKHFYGTGRKVIQDRVAGIKDLLEGKFIEPTLCTKLFKRDLFNGVDCNERINHYEDLLCNFQLFCKSNKSVYEDKTLYHYIKREDSASRTLNARDFANDISKIINVLEKTSQDDNEIKKYVDAKIVRLWINAFNLATLSSREFCEKLYTTIPKDKKPLDVKTKISFFIIKHFPGLYKKVRR